MYLGVTFQALAQGVLATVRGAKATPGPEKRQQGRKIPMTRCKAPLAIAPHVHPIAGRTTELSP